MKKAGSDKGPAFAWGKEKRRMIGRMGEILREAAQLSGSGSALWGMRTPPLRLLAHYVKNFTRNVESNKRETHCTCIRTACVQIF